MILILFSPQPKGVFKDADTVFVLAYSTIMLNTDLHNPQVPAKQREIKIKKEQKILNKIKRSSQIFNRSKIK